ncbi:hypothetical protein [Actinoplanes auranticolor]|uniref:Uncharacterized protein n=1 Tax=Actinoplanes auranticolor TaxID=47988 RepID=A0A919SVG1_9ACTN|nr:hypothetical protein [Actinoplanes auranticolor]GIM77783.1 hypothetical protein Aau02nite_77680 [Actinoplanes auranticolor]
MGGGPDAGRRRSPTAASGHRGVPAYGGLEDGRRRRRTEYAGRRLFAEERGPLDVAVFAGRVRTGPGARIAASLLEILAAALDGMWMSGAAAAAVVAVTADVQAGSRLVETDTVVHPGTALDLSLRGRSRWRPAYRAPSRPTRTVSLGGRASVMAAGGVGLGLAHVLTVGDGAQDPWSAGRRARPVRPGLTFTHTPQVPLDDVAGGFAGLRRRDIGYCPRGGPWSVRMRTFGPCVPGEIGVQW